MPERVVQSVPMNATTPLSDLHPIAASLLAARGITEAADIAAFLDPDYETGRHDPFLLHDMEAAVERILRAIAANERIVVYSDYDCDGIPGAVILYDFFTDIGFTNFEHYIPHRHYEGFGMSVMAVEKIAKTDAALLITIDCGTTDSDAAARANEAGIDVIITDHHEPNGVAVDAYAVVNPKVGDTYPFKDLCGAGVAFKLVEALIARGGFDIAPGREKWSLDMVGIATIGDMVPLIGENRVLAHYGLTVLRKSRRPGLQQLLRKARADQRYLTEDDIGFTIAPRINAASRMDTPEDAFHMLASRDESEAGARVAHLERLNNERRGIVAAMTKELKKRVGALETLPDVLVLGSPEWRPSLVGLAANGLAETYRRPAFVWGRDGNGALRGSCRSDGTASVVTIMNAASESFSESGGHHMSGGFTIRDEHIHTLSARLNEAFASLGADAVVPKETVVDAELTLNDIDRPLLATLARLAPFGVGHPKPVFAFNGVTPVSVDAFGKTGDHLKLVFDRGSGRIEAISFFAKPDAFTRAPAAGTACRLLAHVEESFFMGRKQVRLRIVDIL